MQRGKKHHQPSWHPASAVPRRIRRCRCSMREMRRPWPPTRKRPPKAWRGAGVAVWLIFSRCCGCWRWCWWWYAWWGFDSIVLEPTPCDKHNPPHVIIFRWATASILAGNILTASNMGRYPRMIRSYVDIHFKHLLPSPVMVIFGGTTICGDLHSDVFANYRSLFCSWHMLPKVKRLKLLFLALLFFTTEN